MIRLIVYLLGCLAIIFLVILATTHIVLTPSNNRDWAADQMILPSADIKGSEMLIHNIRNFTYRSTSDFTADYYSKLIDTQDIVRVWYIVEPFSSFDGFAHTFLSFEFIDHTFLSISVEIRKEKGEEFSPLLGLFNKYELMYVIADEKDVVKLRSNYRRDNVYVYPVKTTPEKAQELFTSMIAKINDLKDNPEFYNSITNTCTTNIVDHIHTLRPDFISSLNPKILLPGYSEKYAYDLGLIDTDLPFEQAREKFHINDRALLFADDPDFSNKIRVDITSSH